MEQQIFLELNDCVLKCPACSAYIQDQREMTEHVVQHTRNVGPGLDGFWQCFWCDKTRKNLYAMTVHIKSHVGYRDISCPHVRCGFCTWDHSSLSLHRKRLHGYCYSIQESVDPWLLANGSLMGGNLTKDQAVQIQTNEKQFIQLYGMRRPTSYDTARGVLSPETFAAVLSRKSARGLPTTSVSSTLGLSATQNPTITQKVPDKDVNSITIESEDEPSVSDSVFEISQGTPGPPSSYTDSSQDDDSMTHDDLSLGENSAEVTPRAISPLAHCLHVNGPDAESALACSFVTDSPALMMLHRRARHGYCPQFLDSVHPWLDSSGLQILGGNLTVQDVKQIRNEEIQEPLNRLHAKDLLSPKSIRQIDVHNGTCNVAANMTNH